MTIGVAVITRNPFAEWKRIRQTVTEARRRGFEVGIALDPRDVNKKEALLLIGWADTFIWHKAPKDSVMERGQNELVAEMRSDFILRVDDDEEPSRSLWDDLPSMNPNIAYTLPVIAHHGGRLYEPGMSIEVRAFPREAHRFAGGLGSEMIVDCPTEPRLLDIIWHYSLYAPREDRDRRAAKLAGMGVNPDFFERFLWEEHMDRFVDMPEGMSEELPSEDPHLDGVR